MSTESLASAIARVGSALEVLRQSKIRPHTFPVRPEFSNWRDEQRAWREGCALLDQAHHMTDLYISGPDALRLLSDTGVNTFGNMAVNSAKQFVGVSPDGFVIGDAVLFRLEDQLFDLVGHPMVLDWVQFHLETGGYDAVTERDDNSIDRLSGPPKTYRFELQGPTALAVLEKAAGAVPDTKFFGMVDLSIAGRRVRGLRHGMAGQPGFELFGPWDERQLVLDALLSAGNGHGLVRVGAKAYSTANLESGWVPAPFPAIYGQDAVSRKFRDWLPVTAVGSLGGSMDSTRVEDYYLSPEDLGYARLVSFDHDFVGRDALELRMKEPKRKKVTLVWNSDDVTDAIGSLYRPGIPAKYIEMPKARYALHQSDKVLQGETLVGVSMDCGYIANEHLMISLATVDLEHAETGTELTVLWGEAPNSAKPQVERHEQRRVRATVAPAPYEAFAREQYRAR